MTEEYLLLKWGTLKGCTFENDNLVALEALKEYNEEGYSISAALQKDNPKQKEAILKMIDAVNGPIQNDWSGEMYTKEQAKEYILNYGKN